MTEKDQESQDAAGGHEDRGIEESPALERTLQQLPPTARRVVEGVISAHYSGPMPNPLAQKLSPEHITQMMKNEEANEVRKHQRYLWTLAVRTITIFLLVALLVFCIIYLRESKELLTHLITGLISLLAGAFGGYGYAMQKGEPKE